MIPEIKGNHLLADVLTILTQADIKDYNKADLKDLVCTQSVQISALTKMMKSCEKQLQHLYHELGAQNQKALFSAEKIQALQNQIYGRSSEKRQTPDPFSPLFDSPTEGVSNDSSSSSEEDSPKPKSGKSGKKGSKKPKRKKAEEKVAENVPIVDVFHGYSDEQAEIMGYSVWHNQYEVSELLTVVPTSVQIERHHRQKYFFVNPETGEKSIHTAPGPVKLREGSQYSIEFTAHIASNKYQFHLPVERQVTMLEAKGLTIGASSLFNQLDYAAWVLEKPVAEKIVEDLKASPVVEADDTTWMNLEDLKTRTQDKYYLWGMKNERAVCFNIYDARSQRVAIDFLGDQKGVLVSDGHSSFNALVSKDLILASDWSHCRRYFIKLEFSKKSRIFHLQAIAPPYQLKTTDC